MLIWGIMQNFGLNFRTVLFMKIQPTGPIVDQETSNMAHFPGKYLGPGGGAILQYRTHMPSKRNFHKF